MKNIVCKSLLGLLAVSSFTAQAQDSGQPLAGDLRITGSREMEPVLAAWREGFERAHPGVRIVPNLKGQASAIYGLEVRTADVALMDRAINPFERYGTYERSWTYPVEVEIGTGGGYAIYVHSANPLRKLTLAQIDGVFGARRTGGWDKLAWNKSAARGSDRDLRTWGQLGLRGVLSGKAIHVYGPANEGQGTVTDFQRLVLQGGATWNEDLREYADPAAMLAAVARDPAGIAYAPIGKAPPGLVPLAIASQEGGPFIAPNAAALADRSYPLVRPSYLYFTVDGPSGDPAPVKPLVRAFAQYVLSAEGQAIAAQGRRLAALPETVALRQRAIVASDAWPVERPKP